MATLFNTKISVTYPGLLKTIDNAALSATLRELTDGAGNLSGLFLNTAGDFKVSNILEWGSLKDTGTGVTITRYVTSTDGIENFDNNTSLPTTAAVKLYVDTKFATSDTLQEVLSFGNTTGGNDIAVSAGDNITFTDTGKILMGASADLEIYHDGSHSYIKDAGTGNLRIWGSTEVQIQNWGTGAQMAKFVAGAQVELSYDGTKKFETTLLGSTVTGDLLVTGTITGAGGSFLPLAGGTMTGNIVLNDNVKTIYGTASDGLEIYHDGSNSLISDTGTGSLVVRTSAFRLQSSGGEDMIAAFENDNVKLYYNNSQKLSTTNTGVSVTGTLSTTSNVTVGANATFVDNGKAIFGAGSDLQIYHDGSNSFIKDDGAGDLYIRGNDNIYIQDISTERFITCNSNASVDLFYNDLVRLQTTTDGAKVTGNLEVTGTITGSGGSFLPLAGGTMTGDIALNDDVKIKFGNNDFQIYHDGGGSSYIDNLSPYDNNIFIRNNVSADQGGNISIQAKAGENSIVANDDGAVDLYYDNSKKLETTNTGISVTGNGVFTGNVNIPDTGKLQLGSNLDLLVYHNGNDAIVRNYTGGYFIDQAAVTQSITVRVSNANSLDTTALTISRNADASFGRDVTIAGDLTVNGTTTTVNSQTLAVVDPLIQLAKDNTANSLDIGLYGDYNDGTDRFLGLFSDASDGNKFKLFKGTTVEPTTTVNIGGAGYEAADLVVAGLEASDDVSIVKSSAVNLRVSNGTQNVYVGSSGSARFGLGAGASIIQSTGAAFGIGTQDGQALRFGTNNTEVLTLDTSSNASFAGDVSLLDNKILKIGTGNDLTLKHNATDSFIENQTGHLNIVNYADDKNIQFWNDNGSGGVEVYFQLEGVSGGGSPFTVFPDNSNLVFGAGHDFRLYHTGGTSLIENYTGDIEITNFADDSDIRFKSDNGSGGTIEYFRLDGGSVTNQFLKTVKLYDAAQLWVGDNNDLQIYHDGSNSYIDNNTGALLIRETADNADVIIQSDNGGGGLADYFRADGSTGASLLYHLGSEKFATTSTGVNVTSDSNISVTLEVGASTSATDKEGIISLFRANSSSVRDLVGQLKTDIPVAGVRGTMLTSYQAMGFKTDSASVGHFAWINDTDEKMRLTSSGLLGVGIETPGTLHGVSYGTTKLHIDGRSDRGQVIIEGDAFAGLVLSDNGATANERVFSTSVDGGKYQIKPLNDNGTSSASVGAVLLHDGKFGLGTITPEFLIDAQKGYVSGNGKVAKFRAGNDATFVQFDTVQVVQSDVPCLAIIEASTGTQSDEQKLTFSAGDTRAIIGTSTTVTDGMSFYVNRAVTAHGYAVTGTRALHLQNDGNADFSGNISISAGKKLQYSANSYMTPENNVSGAEISTAGDFRVKTGSTPALALTIGGGQEATFTGNVSVTNANTPILKVQDTTNNHFVFMAVDDSNSFFRSDNNLLFQINNGENGIVLTANGAAKLYYDNANKFETKSNGVLISNTGAPTSVSMISDDPTRALSLDFLQSNGAASGQILYYTNPSVGRMDFTVENELKMRIGANGVIIGDNLSASATGQLDVHGAILAGSAFSDGNIQMSQTGMNTQESGSIEFTQGYSGTGSVGDSIVFTYEALSWKSWRLEYTISSTDGMTAGQVGGYNNGGSGHAKYESVDTLGTTVGVTNNGQHVIVTFTFTNLGTHPAIFFKYSQGGGDGKPIGSRAKIVFNS